MKKLFTILLFTASLFATETSQENLDIVWIVVATSLVFLMQAGFTALEAGLVRAKNSINVAVKNFSDLTFAIIAYFLTGYAIMFGTDYSGFFGTSGFLLEGQDKPYDYAFFMFQAVFAGTVATIVSGAVAERMQFGGYLFVSFVLSALIYPVSGHWVWGSGGWLAEKGFIDFAGSTVVHSVGAWIGLVGAWMLGPRIGRFDKDGNVLQIPGTNLQMATVGVFILWFGWFGFNGGSTLVGDGSIAKVVTNTSLAAAVAGVIGFMVSRVLSGRAEVSKLINGSLAGLVAITAGCAVVEPMGALFIGIGAGVVVSLAESFLLNVMKIDDPIGAIPVHGVAGVWGTLALAFFAPVEALSVPSHFDQFIIQLTGVGATFVWAIVTGIILFSILKLTNSLRVPPEYEIRGLNESEHGAKQSLIDTYDAVDDMIKSGDFKKKIEIEIGTEAGDIAKMFNIFSEELMKISEVANDIAKGDLTCQFEAKGERDTLGNAIVSMLNDLNKFAIEVRDSSNSIAQSVSSLGSANSSLQSSNTQLIDGVEYVSNSILESNNKINIVDRLSKDGIVSLNSLRGNMTDIDKMMMHFKDNISELDSSVIDINSILSTISDIADQTNLLALNAAIEAARAGNHGRGFAVVADEVRILAEKTQNAVKDIDLKLKNLKQHSTEAVDNSNSVIENIENSVTVVNSTTDSFNVIQNDITDIKDRINSVSDTMQKQTDITEFAKEVADNINETIENLLLSMNRMKSVSTHFKVKDAI
jgi:Amt family ammonium transporter